MLTYLFVLDHRILLLIYQSAGCLRPHNYSKEISNKTLFMFDGYVYNHRKLRFNR